MQSKYGFVVAGTQSGCGKTTITLALMAAFRDRRFRVQPFKVGPDFIDPGLHTQVVGVESRNLDGWMLSEIYNKTLFQRLLSQADMGIVEGVMGLYDGYDGTSEWGSTAQMAKWLDLPVILVVDARSMARSAAALVHGFSRFDPRLKLAGVIFNRIGGPEHLEYLREAMSANLPEIPVFGGIPRDEHIGIPERHLGLITSDEIRLNSMWQKTLAGLAERHLDMDLILQKTGYLKEFPAKETTHPAERSDICVTIAVARDAAFCFYYPDNLDYLHRAGAELHFFSPLKGETFPETASGLYLGGGYPEVHAESLFQKGQSGFLEDVRKAVRQEMPIYAECGGLMVLSRFIETTEGKRYPMAGILPFGTHMLSRRKALGYTEVMLRRPCILGDPGLRLRGHEFHYSEIVEEEDSPSLEKVYEIQGRKDKTARLEGYRVGSVLASYVHLHWGSAPEAASHFVEQCAAFEARRKAQGARGEIG